MFEEQKKKTTQKKVKKKEGENQAVKISQTKSDVKSYLGKFKADVARKTKEYQEYTQKWQKTKN